MFPIRSLIVSLALVTAASAQTFPLTAGRTTVNLNTDTLSVLTALKVQVGVGGLGRLNGAALSFPITVGSIDASTLKAEVLHAGSLVLTVGNNVLTLSNFTIDTTGANPALSALAISNGTLVGRVNVFALALPAGLAPPVSPAGGALIYLPGIAVTLSSDGAAALNQVFGVTVFSAGIPIGTAQMTALIDADYVTVPQTN